jgi:hypothetical protein
MGKNRAEQYWGKAMTKKLNKENKQLAYQAVCGAARRLTHGSSPSSAQQAHQPRKQPVKNPNKPFARRRHNENHDQKFYRQNVPYVETLYGGCDPRRGWGRPL